MAKPTGPTNINTRELIQLLRKASHENKVDLWSRVAKEIEKPRRRRREVNLITIAKHLNKGETAIIPGKLLALGEPLKDVKIAAFMWSKAVEAKASPITIQQLLKENPKATNVRILC